jgi:hypothetical protein
LRLEERLVATVLEAELLPESGIVAVMERVVVPRGQEAASRVGLRLALKVALIEVQLTLESVVVV